MAVSVRWISGGTIDESKREMALYVVNRSADKSMDAEIAIATGLFDGHIRVCTINGPDIKSENTFQTPDKVRTRESSLIAKGPTMTCTFEPHSITALICQIS